MKRLASAVRTARTWGLPPRLRAPSRSAFPALATLALLVASASAGAEQAAAGASATRHAVYLPLAAAYPPPRLTRAINLGGQPRAVAVADRFAYVAAGRHVEILEAADPTWPQRVGSIPRFPAPVQHLKVREGRLAAAGEGFLRLFGLEDPLAPTPLGEMAITGRPESLVAGDGFLAWRVENVAWVLDTRDPRHPVGVAARAYRDNALDLDAAGSWLYIHTGWFLKVVSLADPAAPVEVATHDLRLDRNRPIGTTRVLAIDARTVAVTTNQLQLVDVSDPRSPRRAGAAEVPLTQPRFAVLGSTLYIGGYRRETVVDVTDAAAPVVRYAQPLDGSVTAVAAMGEQAVVALGDGRVRWVDLGRPAAPATLGEVAIEVPLAAAVDTPGRRLFAMRPEAGSAAVAVETWDVDPPGIVRPAGPSAALPVYTTRLAVSNGLLLLGRTSGLERGLEILDASATPPQTLGRLPERWLVGALALSGGFAFALDRSATSNSTLHVVDLRDPARPAARGRVAVWQTHTIVPAEGAGHLFLAGTERTDEGLRGGYPCCFYDVLKIVGVSVPTAPRLEAVLRLPGAVTGLAVWRDLLYLTHLADPVRGSGTVLRAYSVERPAQPRPLGSLTVAAHRSGPLTWLAPGAYLVMPTASGLLRFDVNDSGRPLAIEPAAPDPAPDWDVAGMAGGLLWTRSEENGLSGWRVEW